MSQEKIKNFCRALLICVFSSGLQSGIISALCNALRSTSGLLFFSSCNPAWVTLRQKSTLTSVRLWPCSTAALSTESVILAQFSRLRLRSLLQLCSTLMTLLSIMCPHPDRVSEIRFGHMLQTCSRKSLTKLSCLLQRSFWNVVFIQCSMLHTLTLLECQHTARYLSEDPTTKLSLLSSHGDQK